MYECVEVFVLLQQSLTPPVRAVCVDWAEEAKTIMVAMFWCMLSGPGEGWIDVKVNTPSLFRLPWFSSLMTPGQSLN